MQTLTELRDQRANAWSLAQEYNQRDEMSPEDEAAWERALADVDRLTEQIETRERHAGIESRFAEMDAQRDAEHAAAAARGDIGSGHGTAADAERDFAAAFLTFCRGGQSALTPEQNTLMQRAFNPELRAQGTGTGAAGGFTIPEGFWAKVTETMLYYANVAALSEQVTTDSGAALPWPTNDDTANEGVLVAENAQVTEQDTVFGQAQLDAYMYSSRIVRVSIALLQDEGIDLESWLPRKLGERLGRIINRHYTTGTGSSQPQGLITGATVGVTAAAAAAITYDELVDLEHSVDPAYRIMNPQWMFNDATFAYIRKLKDGDQRPLWMPSVQNGAPSTFSGHGYTVNNYMADLATGERTVGFGDVRAALATRQVRNGQLMRLTERYADYLQVGFLAFSRNDSVVQDASAFKVLVQG